MRNLRRLIRRAALLTRGKKRAGVLRGSVGNAIQRRLGSEALEKRELLAGDLGLASNHNYWNAFDVNDDRQITARDALGIINYLSQNGEGESTSNGTKMFYDVNADNRISASDALGVINALGRGEEVGELVELLLTARTTDDVLIAPDASGDVNLNVGEAFDLEIAYDDLRVNQFLQPAVELGVFQLFTDIAVSQPDVLMPILNETQRLIIDASIRNVGIQELTFTIPEAPTGITGGQLSYTSSLAAFGANSTGEIGNALLAFGYTTGQFEVSTLDFGVGGDLGYQIHWIGDEFGNVDLPNIAVDVVETNPADNVPTQTIEFAPFLADGITPNPDAVRFNLNTYSRTFNPTVANPSGEQFYASQNRGTFDSSAGFDEVGGLGLVPLEGGGIPDLTDDGSFDQPFDAFSLRVYLKSAVTDFIVSVNPGEDTEAMLLYGRDEAVPQDFVLVESVDTNGNGTAQVVVNATVNAPGVLAFDPSTISVDEDAGVASLTVTRTDGSVGAVSVNYATVAGSAEAATDFNVAAGTLNFADGEVTKTLNIPIINDTEIEASETFTVVLSNPTGGATLGTASTATITINDDEVAVPGEFNLDVSTIDVNEDAGTLTLTVDRTGGSDGQVAVTYTTANGTATAGDDYTETSGSLIYQDGEVTKTIVIPILDDSDFEGNETFTVTLSNPLGGATIGTGQTTVTIIDNDILLPGVLSLSSATASVNEDAGTLLLTVQRTGGSDGEVTVDYTTNPGTAIAGTDYTTTADTLTFGDGETSKNIVVPILDDTEIDPNETFTVVLSNVQGGASLGTTVTTTVTIVDDEQPGVLAFSQSSESVNEDDGTVTLTVLRSGGSDGIVTVNYATANGSADGGQDYTAQSGTLTFADGETSQQIIIDITDDILIESNETFSVALTAPGGGANLGTPATVTVTIVEDDVPGTLAFSTGTASVSEDGGTVVLTVNRTSGNDGVVSIDYATLDGTAIAGADYTASSGTLTFGNGVTTQTITIDITDNSVINNDKVFSVQLSNETGGASLGSPSVVSVTILEDDIELFFDPSSVSVNENAGTASLSVKRIGDVDAEVTVDFSTADGTALAGSDYTSASGSLTFAAGVSTQSVTVSLVNDNQEEAGESFNVNLANPSGAAELGAASSATVNITNDDVAGTLSIQSAATVTEKDGTVTLTVTRANGSDGNISVDFTTIDGTALAGLDYTAASGTLNFEHNELSKTIDVVILDDILGSEVDETFSVVLSNATEGADLNVTTSVVTIQNVNEAPTTTPVVVPAQSEENPVFTVTQADLIASALDRESDSLSVANFVRLSGDGRGVVANTSSLTVTPGDYGYLEDGQSAVIVYSYDISDGRNTVSNTVTITITGFNDAPIAVDDINVIAFKGATSNIRVLDNDNAGDGETQTLTITSASSANGVVQIKADGTLDFTPAEGFLGATTIDYTISDSQGKTANAVVYVEVKDFLPSSVSGYVFIDEVENSATDIAAGATPIRNGEKDADEQGLTGALISLYSAAADNVTGEVIEDTTLTDTDGMYSFGNLAPGTYSITYQATDAVLFIGQATIVHEIQAAGGVDSSGLDFALLSLAGQVDILASSYYYRDGGVVSLDSNGVQEFVTSLDGYNADVKFVEFALSDSKDSALLTLVEDDGDVMTALLSKRDFRLFGDSAFFFKSQSELTYLNASDIAGLSSDYPSYRDAVDQVLADM
ncbi:Ig-like domain-containing protein [Rubripirellula sp.]|nr:Ig-like domain-containing protein [Rubripirellula sp.]